MIIVRNFQNTRQRLEFYVLNVLMHQIYEGPIFSSFSDSDLTLRDAQKLTLFGAIFEPIVQWFEDALKIAYIQVFHLIPVSFCQLHQP